MSNVIVFGREKGRIIPNKDISGEHAQITHLGNGMFEVLDLDSTNGTYVNGYRIKKATVSLKDSVRLSSDVLLDLSKEFGLNNKVDELKEHKANPKDFTNEFVLLKGVYDTFYQERKKILKRHRVMASIVRAVVMIVCIAPMFIWSDIPLFRYGSTFGVILASFINIGANVEEKLKDLEDSFLVRYVCPNSDCNTILGRAVSWKVLHDNPGKCQKCGAIYNKSKL